MIEIAVWCDAAECVMNVCTYPVNPGDVDATLTRRYVADLNWSCDERGDFCPDHTPEVAS